MESNLACFLKAIFRLLYIKFLLILPISVLNYFSLLRGNFPLLFTPYSWDESTFLIKTGFLSIQVPF
jgi:hypothetical protein